MAQTLGSFAAEIAAECDRPDRLEDIKRCLRRSVTEAGREWNWFTESRLGRIDLIPGQSWYGKLAALSPERIEDLAADGATRLYEDGVGQIDDYPWTLDGPDAAGGLVRDLIQLSDARLVRADITGRMFPLEQVRRITQFNDRRRELSRTGEVELFILYGGQIGFHPVPDAAHVVRLWGRFRPVVPTQDAHGSVFFEEAENWIRYEAKRMLYADYLRDAEQAAEMAGAAAVYKEKIDAESNRRGRRNRLRLARPM